MKKFLEIFDRKQIISIFLILLLMIINAFLEIFSLSLIVPLLNSVLSDNINEIIFLKKLIFRIFNYFDNSNKILLISIFFVSIFLIKNIIYTLLIWLQSKLIFYTQASLSNKLLSSYISNSIIFHEENNSSKLIRNAIIEMGQFANGILLPLLKLTTEVFVLIAAVLFIFFINVKITLFFLSIFIISVFIYYILLKKNLKIWGIKRQEFEAIKIKEIKQSLESIKEIKLYNKENYFINLFSKFNNLSAKMNFYQLFFSSLPKVWLETIALILIFLIIYIYSLSNSFDISTIPLIGMFIAIVIRLMPSFSRILSSIQIIKFSIPSLKIILNEVDNKNFNKKFIKLNNKDNFQNLKIDKVSFKYGNNYVFKNINFEINKFDKIGISGNSGIGKTTLLYLLMGFYECASGKIFYNNINIADSLNKFNASIGFVPQKISLLNENIKKNIAFGLNDNEIDLTKIKKLLHMVKLEDFVSKLPNGLETTISEMGNNISGGQIQRIAIARALYFDPEIIIFDEASNAIDQKTEFEIYDNLFKEFHDKTFILISHRKETLNMCNKIFDISLNKMI